MSDGRKTARPYVMCFTRLKINRGRIKYSKEENIITSTSLHAGGLYRDTHTVYNIILLYNNDYNILTHKQKHTHTHTHFTYLHIKH